MKTYDVELIVNGERRRGSATARVSLADFLRQNLFLTGTHVGCEQGVCGSCTVLLEGEPVRSCLMLAVQADGLRVVTIEGLSEADGRLSVIQEALRDAHAFQCGFCTPGFLTTIQWFLGESPNPSEREIREALAGNLCRCTGYEPIVTGVEIAAQRLAGQDLA
jgi:aerobic carbon-monoxide dehydrogenase small subunit